jgi:hypothetical protein
MLWCCVTPERRDKTRRIMEALAQGWGEPAQVIEGSPPDDGEPFVIWGHRWLAETVIPQAEATGRPYWFIDNGFWNPGGNDGRGYYRFTYRGLSPVLMTDPQTTGRSCPKPPPWRTNGRHILIAMPGAHFGAAHGLDLTKWRANIEHKVRKHTRRPVIVRRKGAGRSLAEDLYDCWALVTHSSNAAVDAVIAGVPVFVDEASAAAPVGNLDLAQIEQPVMPDRTRWLHSLACQHFTLDEMRDGTAWRNLSKVRAQAESSRLS